MAVKKNLNSLDSHQDKIRGQSLNSELEGRKFKGKGEREQ
jgi:hypothetical protein